MNVPFRSIFELGRPAHRLSKGLQLKSAVPFALQVLAATGLTGSRVGNGWAWHVVKYEPSVQPEHVVKPDWVHTMPVISTAHLRMETAQLDWAEVWPMLVSAVPSDDSGIMVKLRDTPKGELPEELEAVLQWAKQLGYTWVRFDSDGDVIEGLPVFDW